MSNKRLPIKIGDKFGKLTVISSAGKDKEGKLLYRCQCECGTIKPISASRLFRIRKGTRSCRCKGNWKARFLLPPEYVTQRVMAFYKRQSKKRSINWGLEESDFSHLIFADCTYCGGPPTNFLVRQGARLFYNGIDRRDNTKGYVSDNAVPCCFLCNRMKSNLSEKEFLRHVSKIAGHIGG